MAINKEILAQIQFVNRKLTESSFQIDFNFPSDKNNVISWSNAKDISFVLKNIPYNEIYNECINERAFNFKLIDGALIQFMYKFDRTNIIQHRLAFLPNPNNERFQDTPEEFEEKHFGRELFSDMYEKNVVVFPIRFDFDNTESKYIEHDHPYSHLTLGNYKNCRIAVSQPITPYKFINFILRSFYFDKYKEHYNNNTFKCNIKLPQTISNNEKQNIHIAL